MSSASRVRSKVKPAPSRLRMLERARRLTAACHRAVVRAVSQRELLDEICRIIQEEGGYTMAWVGLVRHDAAFTLERAAAAGRLQEYFSVHTSWADNEAGSGPSGIAVRTRAPQIVRDVRTDPRFARLRPVAEQHGIKSAVALPLIGEGNVIGVLGLLADQPRAFEPEEIQLLEELCGDLAYGYWSLRLKESQREAESRLRKLDRARRVMAECNRALARAADERALYREICGILTGPADYQATWIGSVESDGTIRPVAHAGFPGGYFDEARISWRDGDRPIGPAGRAVLEGTPQLVSNVDISHGVINWRSETPQRAGSALIMPLKEEGRVTAVLGVITGEKDPFDSDEVELLQQLAGDIAYGRANLRHRDAQRLAEEEIRRSEERYRSLTRLVCDWYWEQDEHYRFTHLVSQVPGQVVDGLPMESVIGKMRWDVPYRNMTPGDWAAHRAQLDARETFFDLDLQSLDANGVPVWIRVSGHPVFDSSGRFTGYRGIARDITDRKRADQLRNLEHAVSAALAETQDAAGAMTLALKSICEYDGWECARYFECDDRSEVMRLAHAWGVDDPAIQRFIEGSGALEFKPGMGLVGQVWQSREALGSRDLGHDPRALRTSLSVRTGMLGVFAFPVLSGGRCMGAVVLTSRAHREADDMVRKAMSAIGSHMGQFAARRRAEEALRKSEERFRGLTQLSSDWYWEQDSEFRFTELSGGEFPGVPSLGSARWEIAGVEARDWQAHRAVLEAHQAFRDFECTQTMASGERRYMSISGQPLFDAGGRFIGYRGTGRDVTEHRRIEEELRRFRASMDMSGDMILIVDRQSMRFVDVNAQACRLLGYTREELLRRGPADVMPESREELESNLERNMADPNGVSYRRGVYFCKDGTELPFEATRCMLESQGQWRVVVIARDIRERIAAEQERRLAEERIRNQAHQQRLIAEFGRHALGNADLADVLNRAVRLAAEALETDHCDMMELDPDGKALTLRAAAGRPSDWIDTHKVSLREGSLATYQLTRSEAVILEDLATDPRFPASGLPAQGIRSGVQVPIHGTKGLIGLLGAYALAPRHFTEDDVNFLGSIANILAVAIERKNAEDRLAYLAQFDALTGLPNRHLFHDRLAQMLAQAKRNNSLMAVLFIDLDRFKLVNDTLGHAVGDKLLKEAAVRLQQCVRLSDTVGRLGGDEFSAILSELSRPADASVVAQKVIEALTRPFVLDGYETYVSASIGITVFPDDGDAPGTLIMNADAAMYRAKEQGRDNFQFFTREMNERALARVQMESQLRRAIERSEFILHYQPRIDLATGTICGFEALLRWNHPDRGVVSPAEFIPVLEDTGLILPVGEWVIGEACRRMVEWRRAGLSVPPVAVNLSARQFQQKDLESSVRRIVAETGADATLLQFEITESLLMDDPAAAARTLRGLRDSGVKLSVDDFGTGYSSLAYLKRFPLDALKIDRAFVRDIATDPEDAAIALAIINLAHTLELQVVAEGVETEAQLDFLIAHGCDEMQGYYFCGAVDPQQCEAMLRDGARLVPGSRQLPLHEAPRAA